MCAKVVLLTLVMGATVLWRCECVCKNKGLISQTCVMCTCEQHASRQTGKQASKQKASSSNNTTTTTQRNGHAAQQGPECLGLGLFLFTRIARIKQIIIQVFLVHALCHFE